MKTREEIRKHFEPFLEYYESDIPTQISKDLSLLKQYAIQKDYYLTEYDAFAIGYMIAQSNLQELFNEEELKKAIEKYNETDVIGLSDTVGEVFMDLFDLEFD